jgi:RNA polymerase sigma-70 factor, ECF subfamily
MDETRTDAEELESRLGRADPGALGEVFALHRPRLWRMVNFRLDRRMVGRVDPDDVLQEAYLAAAQRIEHYGGDGFHSPFLWLRMIVQQTMIDVHRRHLGAQARDAAREVAIFGSYPQATSASMAIQLVGDWTTPSQAAVRGEMLDRVQAAIATMNPMDQEILALRHFEELNNTEVSQTLGIEPKAASIRYVRALKRLKEILCGLPGLSGGQQDG